MGNLHLWRVVRLPYPSFNICVDGKESFSHLQSTLYTRFRSPGPGSYHQKSMFDHVDDDDLMDKTRPAFASTSQRFGICFLSSQKKKTTGVFTKCILLNADLTRRQGILVQDLASTRLHQILAMKWRRISLVETLHLVRLPPASKIR